MFHAFIFQRMQKSNDRKDKELANLNIQFDAKEERLRAADSQVQVRFV